MQRVLEETPGNFAEPQLPGELTDDVESFRGRHRIVRVFPGKRWEQTLL